MAPVDTGAVTPERQGPTRGQGTHCREEQQDPSVGLKTSIHNVDVRLRLTANGGPDAKTWLQIVAAILSILASWMILTGGMPLIA